MLGNCGAPAVLALKVVVYWPLGLPVLSRTFSMLPLVMRPKYMPYPPRTMVLPAAEGIPREADARTEVVLIGGMVGDLGVRDEGAHGAGQVGERRRKDW